MTSGQYDVYHLGNQAERITITVDGHQVTITGPRWNGRGVFTDDGAYLGIAVCPLGTEAFHHASDVGAAWVVVSRYPSGDEDVLEWRKCA